MASYTADTVIEQCQAFIDMGDSNYLISTFVDRIQKLTDLSESEKSDYIQKKCIYAADLCVAGLSAAD